jgi:hypothetical protein
VEAAKCGVPSGSQGRPRTAANSRVESSGGVGKRDGSVPQLWEEVQRDCRQAAHSILREQGQADAQDEHEQKEMSTFKVMSLDIISIDIRPMMIIKR